MSCTPLPKAAKPVWAKQLTRLPCLVVSAKFQFVYTTKSWVVDLTVDYGVAGREFIRKSN